MTATTLDRRIGSASLAVTIAGQAVPTHDLGPVTIRFGRTSPEGQPEAASCTLAFRRAAVDQLPDVGDQLVVELGADALATFALAGTDREDTTRRRFTGLVTDVTADPAAAGGAVVAVTAVHPRAGLGRLELGDTPWPAELDGARAARILQLAAAGAVVGKWDRPTYGVTVGVDVHSWWATFFGSPTGGTVTADPDGESARITWDAKAPGQGANVWLYAADLVVGRTYNLAAEVWVDGTAGTPGVVAGALFVAGAGASHAAPGTGWQVVSTSFVATQTALAIAISTDQAAWWSGWPAGRWCKVRRVTWYEAGAVIPAGVDPGTVTMAARDVDRQPALSLLDDTAVSAEGVLVDRRDGLVEWHDAAHRRGAVAQLTLDAGDVLRAGATWAKSVAGLATDVTVDYGPTSARGEVVEVDAEASARGRFAVKLDTQLDQLVDAQQLAHLTVARRSRARWRLPALDVELSRLDDPALAGQLLGLTFGQLVDVTGFPAAGPFVTRALWVEGWQESWTAKGVRLQLEVVDVELRGAPSRWVDVDPALTWAAVEPGRSWIGALVMPATVTTDRWVDQPADLAWDEVATTRTWATY